MREAPDWLARSLGAGALACIFFQTEQMGWWWLVHYIFGLCFLAYAFCAAHLWSRQR